MASNGWIIIWLAINQIRQRWRRIERKVIVVAYGSVGCVLVLPFIFASDNAPNLC